MNLTEHDWKLIDEALIELIFSKRRMISALENDVDASSELKNKSLAFHKQELKDYQDTRKKIVLTTTLE
jgi:hypothetical protein